ncbi:MAG: MFS transporter [archaeon]
MGILLKRKPESFHLNRITKLAIVGLLCSLSFAYINTIWAVYLDSFISSTVVIGFFSAFLTVIGFLACFLFIPIIEKNNKAKLFSISLVLFIIAYLLFAFTKNFYLMILLSIFVTLVYALRMASFGILIKDNSSGKKLSKNEGMIYTLMNVSWVVGPLVAGYVAAGFGIRSVFILAAIFIAVGLLFFKLARINGKKRKNGKDNNILKNFLAFFSHKKRVVAYFLGAGVNFWWALIYLFIPLMILHSGLGDLEIGYFLFAVAVPLISFEYFFSKWAGKHGFSGLFKLGYFIVAVFSISCFFFSNIYIILALLALASIGMAMLEPTTEAYFFDILKKEEIDRFYGPYNTAVDTGSFIGKFFASILLILLPFKFIFLLFGGVMFTLFLLSFKTKNIVESKKL